MVEELCARAPDGSPCVEYVANAPDSSHIEILNVVKAGGQTEPSRPLELSARLCSPCAMSKAAAREYQIETILYEIDMLDHCFARLGEP